MRYFLIHHAFRRVWWYPSNGPGSRVSQRFLHLEKQKIYARIYEELLHKNSNFVGVSYVFQSKFCLSSNFSNISCQIVKRSGSFLSWQTLFPEYALKIVKKMYWLFFSKNVAIFLLFQHNTALFVYCLWRVSEMLASCLFLCIKQTSNKINNVISNRIFYKLFF